MMKKTKLLACLIVLISMVGTTFGVVPDYYKANYAISNDWENIKKIFVEIEANNQIGEETSSEKFNSLYSSFNSVFPKFPQEYNFQIVYEKCKTLTQNLGNGYNYNTFASFMDNCFKPLSNILNIIDSKYTIKADIKANPTNGSVPLTVTFNATASIDPSSETIPENNYFRYYRDVNGVDQIIGNKSVLSYTFEKAGTHIIHLTVRSSNNNNGIFDGEKNIAIEVKPMSAAISVYANGKHLINTEKLKFGTQEGVDGIILDGSTTIPIGERKIEKHSRDIQGGNNFSIKKSSEGAPGAIRVSLPNEGEYKITLKTRDNEGNENYDTYSIVLADPVAIIKKSPEEGTTSTIFTFDASSSFSVTSSIKLYTREIYNSNGKKLTTYQGKSIKYQFLEPGSYTVKLNVTDNLGETNTDIMQVFVESSNPIAQFTYTPSSNRTNPSKFIFDASTSSDIDVTNGVDSLYYSRTFSNPETTTIQKIEGDNKKIKVSFDSLGEQTVKLTVSDNYGKTNTIEKKIYVQSTLRPDVTIMPQATTWGNPINFIVKSNKKILSYSRTFGDGATLLTQSNKVSHTYSKVGIYKVTLRVNGENGDENFINENVFIGEKNFPIAAFKVRNNLNETIKQNEECIDGGVVYPAYKVTRYEAITIDPSDSVNTKGTTTDLKFFFQPKYGEIYNLTTFKPNFNELGCTYVDMTVEDSSIGVSSKQRIRFKVYNNLPNLDNLTISFPQYGNDMTIGFNQSTNQNVFNSDADLTVKVTAQNSQDTDGFISYYKRYYYYKDDPSRWLETKITPSSINYTYFQLTEPGEYVFGVTIYDNDEGKTSSEEVLGNGPMVLITQDSKNIDIPIVTLKSNKNTVEVGDDITFSVSAKIISDRSDFLQERTIRYDFDGDGERDLTTKDDEVTYNYEKPNENGVVPRASVLYRGYVGTAKGGSIIVKDALKPRLLYTKAGKYVLFRDVSLGPISKSTTCLSLIDCKKNNNSFIINNSGTKYYIFKYPEYDKYFISMDLEDEYANSINKRIAISIDGIQTSNGKTVNYTGDIKLLSIPENYEKENGTLELFVGNNLNNSVVFYVLNENIPGKCYVDLDITDDIEKDFSCNEPYLAKYTPQYSNKIGRIYYEKNNTLKYKEFSVSFLDYSVKLNEEQQKMYDKISELLKTVSDENLRILLLNLQQGLISEKETEANTIALHDYLAGNNKIEINDNQKEELGILVNELSDATVLSAIGGTEYEIAKANILLILPTNLKTTISRLFYDFEVAEVNFENGNSQQDERKAILQQILTTIQGKSTQDLTNQKDDEITKDDLDGVIVPNICIIMKYYNITSSTNLCGDAETVNIPEDNVVETVSKKRLSTGLRILIISLSSLIGLFLILVIFFAVKAKINNNKEDEE